MSFVENLKKKSNETLTENGALTNISTFSFCLDLFYMAGAMRNSNVETIIDLVEKAFYENKDITMKILFFTRDVRGGLGERRFFKIAINTVAKIDVNAVKKNTPLIPEYGRWDDILTLYDISELKSDIVRLIRNQLETDILNMKSSADVSLLAKWLPSVNTSSKTTIRMARKLAKDLEMTESEYRKTLSSLRKYIDIIENRLREKDYTFDYSKQPSKALFKYKMAFIRNDNERYMRFIRDVSNGKANLNTSTLYPYEIVRKIIEKQHFTEDEINSLDATWNSLSDIENSQNAIAVVDGSGSMYWGLYSPKPYEVALSLGIYFAEHCKGVFKNHFITFSETPRLIEINGETIVDKVKYCCKYNECANTNVQAVFDLILNTAVENNAKQDEIPEFIYIISDMEFDSCAFINNHHITNYDLAKRKFKKKGYELPKVIFWNVGARNMQVPVSRHESGTALVSGSSPKLFDMVKSGQLNPYNLMMDIISSERYNKITA
jgi:hypothetical protein